MSITQNMEPDVHGWKFRGVLPMQTIVLLVMFCVGVFTHCVSASERKQLVKPSGIQRVIADGTHNAFTAMVRWHKAYWLSFRSASSHGSLDGDLVVLRSTNAEQWHEVQRFDILPDDRDPQFLATPDRLFLYDPARHDGSLTSLVTYTDNGKTWSPPQQVYHENFIIWKPVARAGRFFASAHISSSNGHERAVHLIASNDGLNWEKISEIRSGNWESETTIHFTEDEKIVGFLRQIKESSPSAILESLPPYTNWSERKLDLHLSGHAVYTFDGVTYLFSRIRDRGRRGTIVYLYESGELLPYCEIPSGGDCSYPAAVRLGAEMLVSYYSSHEGSTNIYTCRVPLHDR